MVLPKLLSFNPISKTLIYPFIIPLCCFLNGICFLVTTAGWSRHSILTTVFIQLAILLVGLLDFFIQYNLKDESMQKPTAVKYTQSKIALITDKEIKEPLLFMVILGTLSTIFTLCIVLSFYKITFIEYKLAVQVLQILFAAILSKYILKFVYYYHHLIAFLISLFGFSLVIIFAQTKIVFNWGLLIFLIFNLLSTLLEVCEKWLMDSRYVNPFRLLFIEGAAGVLTSLVILSLTLLIPCGGFMDSVGLCNHGKHVDTFYSFLLMFKEQSWLYFILFMITSAGFYAFSKLTVYHYSPTHKTMSDVIGTFFFYIFCVISFHPFSWFQIVGYIILIISCLWFNEIMTVHFCNLDRNTKAVISTRNIEDYCQTGQMGGEIEEITTNSE